MAIYYRLSPTDKRTGALSHTTAAARDRDFVNAEAFSLLGGSRSEQPSSPRKRVFFHSNLAGEREGVGASSKVIDTQEKGKGVDGGAKASSLPDRSWRSDYKPGRGRANHANNGSNDTAETAPLSLASPLQQVTRVFFAVLEDADERQARQEAVHTVIAHAEKERAHRVAELRVRALNIMKGREFNITIMSQLLPFTLGIDDESKATIIVAVASNKRGFGGNEMRPNHISEGDQLVAINDQPVDGWLLPRIRARLDRIDLRRMQPVRVGHLRGSSDGKLLRRRKNLMGAKNARPLFLTFRRHHQQAPLQRPLIVSQLTKEPFNTRSPLATKKKTGQAGKSKVSKWREQGAGRPPIMDDYDGAVDDLDSSRQGAEENKDEELSRHEEMRRLPHHEQELVRHLLNGMAQSHPELKTLSPTNGNANGTCGVFRVCVFVFF
jgi:hypothetical protein